MSPYDCVHRTRQFPQLSVGYGVVSGHSQHHSSLSTSGLFSPILSAGYRSALHVFCTLEFPGLDAEGIEPWQSPLKALKASAFEKHTTSACVLTPHLHTFHWPNLMSMFYDFYASDWDGHSVWESV